MLCEQILLRDNQNLFKRVLFYGIEGDLLILDLLVFIIWDLIFTVRQHNLRAEWSRVLDVLFAPMFVSRREP